MHPANREMWDILNDLRHAQELVSDFSEKLDEEDNTDEFIQLRGNMRKFVFHAYN
jgi:hypothetical protein